MSEVMAFIGPASVVGREKRPFQFTQSLSSGPGNVLRGYFSWSIVADLGSGYGAG